MLYVTSLTADGLRGSSMLLSGFISPRCQFLGRTMSSELVFIIVHIRHTGNFLPKILNNDTTKRFCCDLYMSDGAMKV